MAALLRLVPIMGWVLSLTGWASSGARAVEPIRTNVEFKRQYAAFLQEQQHDERIEALDPESVRPQVAAFLVQDLRRIAGLPGEEQDVVLATESRRLRELGTHDPRALLAIHCWIRHYGAFREAGEMRETLRGIADNEKNSAFVRFKALRELIYASMCLDESAADVTQRLVDCTAALRRWLKSLKTDGNQLRFAADVIDKLQEGDLTIEQQRIVRDAMVDDAEVDEWLRTLVDARYQINLAWHYRGGAYASETSDEQLRKFSDSLPEAVRCLERCIDLQPDFPEAAAHMITMEMAGAHTGRSARQWFDEARRIHFDYSPAYDHYLETLEPKWGGSYQKMYEFCVECEATDRWDTNVPSLLMMMTYRVFQQDRDAPLFEVPGLYDHFHKVMQELYRRKDWKEQNSPLGGMDSTKMFHAAAATIAEKYDDARALYDDIGDDYLQYHSKPFLLRMPEDRARVYALSGPAGIQTERLVAMLYDKIRYDAELTKRARRLLEVAKEKDPGPEAQWYFRHWESVLDMEERFAAGEKIEIRFPKDLAGFRILNGTWDVADDGAVSGKIENGGLLMGTAARFRGPYRLAFDIETVEQDSDHWGQSVILGFYPTGAIEKTQGIRLCFESLWDRLHLDRGHQPTFTVLAERRKQRRVVVESWPGYIRMSSNGWTILNSLTENISTDGPVAWGTSGIHRTHHGKLKISNVTIQKLSQDSPPISPDNDIFITYADSILKREPDDVMSLMLRAYVCNRAKRWDEAIVAARRAGELVRDNDGAAMYLADALAGAGRAAEAREVLEKFLARPGEFPQVRLHLAELLAWKGGEALYFPQEALRQVRLAKRSLTSVQYPQLRTEAIVLSHNAEWKFGLGRARLALKMAGEADKAEAQAILQAIQAKQAYRPTTD